MTIDPQQQRKVMGRFATGVTVASTVVDGEQWGMTANAVASLSLDPPLVLLAVMRGTSSHEMFLRGQCFALNVLAADQQHLSVRFSGTGPRDFRGWKRPWPSQELPFWWTPWPGSIAASYRSCRVAITSYSR